MGSEVYSSIMLGSTTVERLGLRRDVGFGSPIIKGVLGSLPGTRVSGVLAAAYVLDPDGAVNSVTTIVVVHERERGRRVDLPRRVRVVGVVS